MLYRYIVLEHARAKLGHRTIVLVFFDAPTVRYCLIERKLGALMSIELSSPTPWFFQSGYRKKPKLSELTRPMLLGIPWLKPHTLSLAP